MASASLLARAKSLVSVRSGLVGALVLTPIAVAQVKADVVFTPFPSGSLYYRTLSGMPEYAGAAQTEIGSSSLAGGAGVKLWGDSEARSRSSFTYQVEVEEGVFETRYYDGLTFAWNGMFSGTVLNSDRLAVNYDFTIDSTYAGNVQWALYLTVNNSSGGTLASGDVPGGTGPVSVNGATLSSNPLTWNESEYFTFASWTIYLVVTPGASTFRDQWAPTDTLHVIVPGDSIDFGLNTVPSAIPEPSTWALVLGGASLAGVMTRRRGRRQA